MNNIDKCKTLLDKSKYEIYSPSNILSFALSEKNTIVTTPLQTFILIPCKHNYNKRLERIRYGIQNGKIKSISQIVEMCGYTPGRRGQMLGIEMVSISLEWVYKIS